MRDLAWWSLPGLIIAEPLALFLRGWNIAAPLMVWFLFALVAGFLLHQSVRWRFESDHNGFRSPQRPALLPIIERGGLAGQVDAGDVAYQVYENVFYGRSDWEAIRGHLHRCWHYVFWFRTISWACRLAAVFALLALLSGGSGLLAMLLLLALPIFGIILHQKAEQTLAALHLFDHGLVLSNWPLYEAALQHLARDRRP